MPRYSLKRVEDPAPHLAFAGTTGDEATITLRGLVGAEKLLCKNFFFCLPRLLLYQPLESESRFFSEDFCACVLQHFHVADVYISNLGIIRQK